MSLHLSNPATPIRSAALLVEGDPVFAAAFASAAARLRRPVLCPTLEESGAWSNPGERPAYVLLSVALPDVAPLQWLALARAGGFSGLALVRTTSAKGAEDVLRLCVGLDVGCVCTEAVGAHELAARAEDMLATAQRTAADLVNHGETLGSLRAEYAAAMPVLVEELATAVAAVCAQPDGSALASLAMACARRMDGTAASLGFPAVNEQVALIRRALGAGKLADPEVQTTLRQAVAAAGAAANLPPPALPHLPGPWRGSVALLGGSPRVIERARRVGERVGLEVHSAPPDRRALDNLRERPPTAVVVDLAVLTDADFAAELRGVAEALGCRIAAVAPLATPSARMAATLAGARAVLSEVEDDNTWAETLAQVARAGRSEKRVLVVDDDPGFRAAVRGLLVPEGIELAELDDEHELIPTLERECPDAVILHDRVRGAGAGVLCRMLRMGWRWQSTPVLVVTEAAGAGRGLAAVADGADDWVHREAMDEQLVLRLEARMRRAAVLGDPGFRDPLTGLWGRRFSSELLRSRLSEAVRHERPFSLVLLDIDDFKLINDRRGHAMGDAVLARLGQLVTSRLRGEDLRGRWGGDELVIGFAGIGAEMAARIVDLTRLHFASPGLADDRGNPVAVSFSAGVASYPVDGDGLQDLLDAADTRLYAAKAAGRNRVRGGAWPSSGSPTLPG